MGNSLDQVNQDNQRWRDARDVDKAYEEFLARLDPTNTPYWVERAEKRTKAFAKYYAQRCGVVLDSECEHPYYSVVGGGGKPERCLRCGKVLSD